jgi:hypothetical protein
MAGIGSTTCSMPRPAESWRDAGRFRGVVRNDQSGEERCLGQARVMTPGDLEKSSPT